MNTTQFEVEVFQPQLIVGDLGSAILQVEDESGRGEPVAIASTFEEARELLEGDARRRSPGLDDLCPYRYTLFVRGNFGKYTLAAAWQI